MSMIAALLLLLPIGNPWTTPPWLLSVPMSGVVRFANQSVSALSSDPRPLDQEDVRLRRLYTAANVEEIARRYRSTGRVRNLSPTSRVLLMQVLLPGHATSLFQALAPILTDDELACVALVAALRSNVPIQLSDTVGRRLARTSDGRLAVTLNTRNLPSAPRPLAPLRAARLAAVEHYFFRPGSTDEQAVVLEQLVHLTMEAFKNGRFTADAPAPPIRFAPKNVTDLALKLAVLPYVTKSDEFLTLFDAVVNSTVTGEAR